MLEINEIKENYEKFDNSKIIRIAESEAKGLRDEVVPILISEIQKRELGEQLIEWIKAERRKLSKQELEGLKRKVENCLCESCQKNRQLKGYKFRTTTGYVIDEAISDYRLIICQSCGRRKRRNSLIWTSIFGWWSLSGIISMPFVLINKIKASFQEDNQSGEIIEAFIVDNIGIITIERDSQEVISELLKDFNKVEGE